MVVKQAAELDREGIGWSERRRRVREGDLVRLRRGAYAEPHGRDAMTRHGDLLAATLPQLDETAVVSHYSAAVLHRFPVPRGRLDKVWITRNSSGGGHLGKQLHELKAPLRQADVTLVDGIPVTSLARTVIDLARRGPLQFGLAAADCALARGATQAELTEQITLWPRRPGMARARLVIPLADKRSESFGESYSRLVMWQLKLPMPELQVWLEVRGRWYRADFLWPEFGVLGEFDGRVKYADLLRPGQTVEDVVMGEKAREQDLRSVGWQVARWDTPTLRDPALFRSVLDGAFAYAAGRTLPASLFASIRTAPPPFSQGWA